VDSRRARACLYGLSPATKRFSPEHKSPPGSAAANGPVAMIVRAATFQSDGSEE